MNRLDKLFEETTYPVLSVYFTAGFPQPDDTAKIIRLLAESGADLLEIGIPFSDPLADGPVIQECSTRALANGFTLRRLFEQLKDVRESTDIPLVLMGYLNPLLQYGMEEFCAQAAAIGIDGLILPDLPPEIYQRQYKELFDRHRLKHILLITPSTSPDRIHLIDSLSGGFIYAVSSSATTGQALQGTDSQHEYFSKLKSLKLKNPLMIGFGISNQQQFEQASRVARGGIIGTAFLRYIQQHPDLEKSIPEFVRSIRPKLSAV